MKACDCDRSAVTWAQVADVDPGVIGGLVLTYAERARAKSYDDRFDRDNMTYHAIAEALEAARGGVRPDQLADRLPSWIVTLLRRRIADHEVYWLDTSFLVARVLELAGLIDLDVDEAYVLAMLVGLTAERSDRYRTRGSPIEWFRQDPQLVERAYWRALAIEGEGVISIRIGTWKDESPWRVATLEMVTEGMVPRDRVIDVCLSALAQDFSSAAARWYVGTLVALDLTLEELEERQPRLVRLVALGHAVISPTVLTWLRRLCDADRLDGVATAPALAAVAVGGPKSTALRALRLLASIRRQSTAADVIPAACAGLAHPHSDVQRAAARLVLEADRRDLLIADVELLDPTVRRELDLPIEREQPLLSDPVDDRAPATVAQRRRPAATDDELVERLAALLEDSTDPDGVELVLDRLARSSAGSLVAPLARRARAVLKSSPGNWDTDDRLELHLAELVLTAVEPRSRVGMLGPPVPRAPGSRFLHHRVAEVRGTLLGDTAPGSLLALPTDPAGWIDPEVFVQRLQRNPNPGRYDLMAALLRLRDADATTALSRWRAGERRLDPPFEQPVRYALGEQPDLDVELKDRSLWVAASRGRHPLEEDPLLVSHGLGGCGQGRPLRATITFGYEADQIVPFAGVVVDLATQADYRIAFDHPCGPASRSRSRRESWWTANQQPVSDQPTAVADLVRDYRRDRETWPTWLATLWPAEAEFFAATAFDAAFDLVEWQTKDRRPYAAVSALARQEGRMGVLACTTLALGFDATAVDARIMAVDHVVDLVARGRMSVAELAAALASSLPVAVLSRWSDSFRRLADAGRADIAIDLLASVLPHVPAATRGLYGLLDVLHQELLRNGRTLEDGPLQAHLSTFGGSSKAARSARAIIALG